MNRPIAQKGGEYRDRKLLDLAHRLHECPNCVEFRPDGLEPAHANCPEFGKGMSIKAGDWAHAALCHTCHAWLDQGKGMDPSDRWTDCEKRQMWERAYWETVRVYWMNGWLKVAA